MKRFEALQRSYDAVAEAYAARFGDELRHKPLDQALLQTVVEMAGDDALVADIGCGPGHVAAHLRGLGARALGIDAAPMMIEVARRLHPECAFEVASMLALPLADASLAAAVLLYSIIHLTPSQLLTAFAELHRAMTVGAPLLVSFHVGDEIRHVDELLDTSVSLDFRFLRTRYVERRLTAAGFSVIASLERLPYTAVEGPTRRGYVLARRDP